MKGSNGFEIVQLRRLNGEGKAKAFCDIALSGLVIKGFSVVEGKKGLFIGMPRQQGKDGKWYEVVTPLDEGTRTALSESILEAYGVDQE